MSYKIVLKLLGSTSAWYNNSLFTPWQCFFWSNLVRFFMPRYAMLISICFVKVMSVLTEIKRRKTVISRTMCFAFTVFMSFFSDNCSAYFSHTIIKAGEPCLQTLNASGFDLSGNTCSGNYIFCFACSLLMYFFKKSMAVKKPSMVSLIRVAVNLWTFLL